MSSCKEHQNSELELLASMYSHEELYFPTKDFRLTCDAPDDLLENSEFCLKLPLDVEEEHKKVEITFRLPSGYPLYEHPYAILRLATEGSFCSAAFNEALRNHIDGLTVGSPLVTEIISWVMEHVKEYLYATETKHLERDVEKKSAFARYWIYSHHIYNKTKRRDLLHLANELKLTGFCLPGKPGIICVEGPEDTCRQFWEHVHSWTWKKIGIKHREIVENTTDLFGLRYFGDFQELFFDAKQVGHYAHMDMGAFKRFLEEHNCGSVFNILFHFGDK